MMEEAHQVKGRAGATRWPDAANHSRLTGGGPRSAGVKGHELRCASTHPALPTSHQQISQSDSSLKGSLHFWL